MSQAVSDHDLLVRLARIEASQTRIEAALAAMNSRAHGLRDGADAALFPAMRLVLGDTPFTSREVFDRALESAALRLALTNADLDTPRQLGRLLARLEGVVGDVRLDRVSDRLRRRQGIVWRFAPMDQRQGDEHDRRADARRVSGLLLRRARECRRRVIPPVWCPDRDV